MKKYALLLVALATTLSLLAQDKYNRYMNVYINGELTYQKAVTEVDSVTFPLLPVEPIATPDIDIPSGTLTVPQANAICSTLGNGETSTAFYVKGWVKEIVQETDTTIRTFYIAEKMYADSTFGDATFLAYQVHYLKNNSFVDESQLAVGDFVVIHGELTNANNTYRTVGNGQAYVYSSNNTRKPFVTLPIPTNITIPSEALTVSQARNICSQLEHGAITEQAYYVKGWVKQIHSNHANGVIGYGNGHFYLAEKFYADSTFSEEEFSAYQVYYLNGEKFSAPDQVKEGDYVVIYGKLTNYNDVYETVGKGTAYVYAISHGDNSVPGIEIMDKDTLTVADMLDMTAKGFMPAKDAGTYQKWVKGYIVGSYNFEVNPRYLIGTENASNTNLLLADAPKNTDNTKVASVKLPQGIFRNQLNIVSNPTNYKKEVLLYGTIETYCGIGGVVNIEKAYLDSMEIIPDTTEITIKDALAINLASGETTNGIYKMTGVISTITEAFGSEFGNATFTIKDSSCEDEFVCYHVKYLNNEKWIEYNPQIEVGQTVTVIGNIRNYNGMYELGNGYMLEHKQ